MATADCPISGDARINIHRSRTRQASGMVQALAETGVDVTKMFLRVEAAGPDGKGLPPTTHDASDRAVLGATQPRAYTAYTDPSGVFTVGVWACDAGTLAIDDLALDEACYLIDGEVIITDVLGNTERFIAGEAFLLKRGFVGTWHMPRPILKYNAMFRRQPV